MRPSPGAAFRKLRVVTAAVAAWLTVLGGAGPLQAAEKLTDHFSRNWYYTEVVVFQRPGVQDHASAERLARPPAALPVTMRSFVLPPEERWSAYRLDPLTRESLALPYLDETGLTGTGGEAAGARPATGQRPPAIEPRLAPDPLLEFLDQVAAFEAALEQDSYQWLEPDTFTLVDHARSLERRGGFEVVLHGRWLQPVPPREAPEPLLVQAGPRYRDTFGLEGTFDVTRGRYLHFRARLLYTEPLLGRLPVDRALPPPDAGGSGTPGLVDPGLDERDLLPAGFMQIHESRRVREGELQYLDHPKLGVLVRIEPATPPPSLVAAFAALEDEAR